MAKLGISTGTNPNDGSGDSLLAGAVKINSNFNEVYAAIGNGSTVSTPVTSITAGDNIIVSGSTGSVTITGIGTADIDTDRINVSGVVTASSFSGSGVNLTNLPSSALVGTLPAVSGANLTGIATFIDAGANITVTTGPTGVTTIASSSGSATTSNVSSNTLVVSGVSTFSGSVSFASSVTFGDNDKIYLGDDDDVEIYWDSSSSRGILDSSGGWDMYGQLIYLYYYNNSADTNTERLQVNSRGITITGDSNIITGGLKVTGVSTFTNNTNFESNVYLGDNGILNFGASNDLQLYHSSAGDVGAFVKSTNQDLHLVGPNNGGVRIITYNKDSVVANYSGSVDLYYDGSKKFSTTGVGVTITGNVYATGVSTFLGNVKVDSFSLKDRDFDILESTSNGVTLQQTGAGKLILRSAGDVEIQSYQGSSLLKTGTSSVTTGGIILYYATGLTTEVERLSTTSTGISVNGALSVSSSVQVGSGQSFGSSTGSGAVYYGDGSNIADGKWTLGANGTSDYTFTGIGLTQTTNDPILYLARGRVYEFVNSMGAHPFEIRQSAGGSAFDRGVTNNAVSNGTLRFEIPFDAPNTLYYQCTSHAGMGSTIVVYPNTI